MEQLTIVREQIAALKADFDALMLAINNGMGLMVTTLQVNLTTLLEATLTPFISGIQQISTWVLFGVSQFEGLSGAVGKMGLAFTTFATQAVFNMMLMVAGTKEQFDAFGLYLEENKGNWAKSWLDFVVAMEVQTTTAVNMIIGEFARLGNNVGGSSLALTAAFSSAMTSVMTQVTGQLEPTLAAGAGAFKGLAQAAKQAANDVAANTAAICDAVTAAYDCVTGSPELVIQHPFEGFSEFLRRTTPAIQSMIEDMVNPMDSVSAQALNLGDNLNNALGRINARAQSFGAIGGQTNVTNNYNYELGPVYQQPQAPASMIDDLALMNLLSGG